jgi:uncharacterized Rossmann fold enzyme
METWLPMYHEICREFGYDEDEDARSAETLSSILSSRAVPSLDELIQGCPASVTVCGDGPYLAESLSAERPSGYVVAADGATTTLMDAEIVPDAIVTDLDGGVEHQLRANARGSLVFVHAHGDNMDVISTIVPRLQGRVVGTCQGPPPGGLLNLGGFTDGDRAVCIFAGLGAEQISLVGFDFDRPSHKASRSSDVKTRKLAWARKVLEVLAEQGVRIEGL